MDEFEIGEEDITWWSCEVIDRRWRGRDKRELYRPDESCVKGKDCSLGNLFLKRVTSSSCVHF